MLLASITTTRRTCVGTHDHGLVKRLILFPISVPLSLQGHNLRPTALDLLDEQFARRLPLALAVLELFALELQHVAQDGGLLGRLLLDAAQFAIGRLLVVAELSGLALQFLHARVQKGNDLLVRGDLLGDFDFVLDGTGNRVFHLADFGNEKLLDAFGAVEFGDKFGVFLREFGGLGFFLLEALGHENNGVQFGVGEFGGHAVRHGSVEGRLVARGRSGRCCSAHGTCMAAAGSGGTFRGGSRIGSLVGARGRGRLRGTAAAGLEQGRKETETAARGRIGALGRGVVLLLLFLLGSGGLLLRWRWWRF